MSDNISIRANVVVWRVIGWLIIVVFVICAGIGLFEGNFTGTLLCIPFIFIGRRLTRYKRNNKDNAAPISTKNHWEEERDNDEVEVDSPFLTEENDDDLTEQAYHAAISKKINAEPYNNNIQHKNISKIRGNSRYRPLQELCLEIENDIENTYLPLESTIPAQIIYTDGDGETTRRKIDIIYIAKRDYDYGDGYYIKAFCHLRNENRTFNIERIQQTKVDGNIVDIIQYIVDTYRNTDKYNQTILSIKTWKLLNSSDIIGHTAKILTYISRIDGIFTRKEKTIIASFIKELDNNRHDIEIENYISELAKLNPSTPEYKNIVKTANISEQLIEKAREITGKDPLRQGAFEILFKQYEKANIR
ncbi:MAG: WYL domain-containing protein [Spirochaetaceae bacterium]|jgi:hypothetical protein|nr:WYL domain-containing protein [Spirochaetaceae bacterium]